MANDDVIDLYTLRCAAAALLLVRHRLPELTRDELDRFDAAVRHLDRVSANLRGDLGTAARALLSGDDDPDGTRTIDAIEQLAELTNVEETSAAALADCLGTPRPTAASTSPTATASPSVQRPVRRARRPQQPGLFDTPDDTEDAV